MIADKLPEIIKTQVDAIKNIKIDKVTVWDSGAKGDGASSTSSFLAGLAKSLPTIDELLKNAGMELPSLLQGKGEGQADEKVEEQPIETEAEEVVEKEEEKSQRGKKK